MTNLDAILRVSKNGSYLICSRLVRKLLISLPVCKNENTIKYGTTLFTKATSYHMKRYHLKNVD
jgi:hypothetical protein